MLVWLLPVNISEGIAETVTLTYREGGVAKDFTGYTATWRIIQEGAVWASGTATLATGLISVPLSAEQTAIPKPTQPQKLNAAAVLEITATNGGVTLRVNATVNVFRPEDSVSGLGILSSAAPSTPPPSGKATPQHFGAIGDGINDDRPAFEDFNAWGGDGYIPKPPVAYNVSSPINLDKVGITVDPTASWEALTDSGNITWNTNLFTQQDPPVPVHRFNGRVFMGDAAHEMAGGWATWPNTTDRSPSAWYARSGPSEIFGGYTHRDATAVIANGKGTIALALSARSSQQWDSLWQAPIGLGIFMLNDGNASAGDSSAWGIIVEGRQTQSGRRTMAMEIALGDTSGVVKTPTPYNVYANPTNGGVVGIWAAGGGAQNSSPSNVPNAAAMVILRGEPNDLIVSGWESGIVFGPDAITGTDGTAGSATFADAVQMARNQTVAWFEPGTNAKAFSITSRYTTVTDASRLEGYAEGGVFGVRIQRQAGNVRQIDLRSTSSNTTTVAVLQAETNTIRLEGEGSATNIDMLIKPKGTGHLRFGTRTASVDVPVTGYIEVKDEAGNVRRLAVVG